LPRLRWQIALAGGLLLTSAAVYILQVAVFHRVNDTLFYLLQDVAFVPIEVVLVTLILAEVLGRREATNLRRRLNMVIGAFYGETGIDLIRVLASFDTRARDLVEPARALPDWTVGDFRRAAAAIATHDFAVESRAGDLAALRPVLLRHRVFLIGLLENGNLLEHEAFAEMLLAVFHLTEELGFRARVDELPADDLDHLSGDLQRAYRLLLGQWLVYLEHLHDDYPYSYSLAVRTNPLLDRR